MANNINGFGFNPINPYYRPESQEGFKKQQKEEKQAENNGQREVNPNDVLNYLNGANADIKPISAPKVLNVEKYVSDESEARIADMMKDFEEHYDLVTQVAKDEFGVSEKEAGVLAEAYFNAI